MLYNILLQEGARSKVPQGYSLTRRSSSDCNSIANRAIWLWRWGVFMAMFLCSTLLQMTYFAVHTLDSIFYKTDYFGIFFETVNHR